MAKSTDNKLKSVSKENQVDVNTSDNNITTAKPVKLYAIAEEPLLQLVTVIKKLPWDTADPMIKFLQSNLHEIKTEDSKKEGE